VATTNGKKMDEPNGNMTEEAPDRDVEEEVPSDENAVEEEA
jgi:hypothetical protein